jgi:hypothetical protein
MRSLLPNSVNQGDRRTDTVHEPLPAALGPQAYVTVGGFGLTLTSFDRGRRGLALQHFDIRRHRDGLNVFEVLIPGSFTPGKKLLDCPVISGSRVSVTNRDRKKLEELFAGRRAGVRDDCGSYKRFY